MSSFRLTLAIDASNPNIGDLYLDDSLQLVWIGGDITDQEDYARMVLQRVRCRLMLIRGEWYLDLRQGTPWFEKIWIKGATRDNIRRIIRTVVEGTPGIESLSSLEVTLDSSSRTATITFVAITDLGTIITTDLLDEPFIVDIPRFDYDR